MLTKITKELDEHKTLKGVFNREDPKWIYKALDTETHKGYQAWHRDYDERVVGWLNANKLATPADFKKFLHGLYQDPEFKSRIPNVNLLDE